LSDEKDHYEAKVLKNRAFRSNFILNMVLTLISGKINQKFSNEKVWSFILSFKSFK